MVNVIKDELQKMVVSILDNTIEREFDKVMIELHSNLGEIKTYSFRSIDAAIDFLNIAELTQVFVASGSLTLFDPPPVLDGEET